MRRVLELAESDYWWHLVGVIFSEGFDMSALVNRFYYLSESTRYTLEDYANKSFVNYINVCFTTVDVL